MSLGESAHIKWASVLEKGCPCWMGSDGRLEGMFRSRLGVVSMLDKCLSGDIIREGSVLERHVSISVFLLRVMTTSVGCAS